ncbi:MAG: BtrH N-terminal domain-containing protein [Deltaproteobacteria bacterium]|nr:BtrH N-terminal domain-containing protein [Deltaproteobacteria bacterium]
MTHPSSFKKKVRARMRKTGERYAAARLALLSASSSKPSSSSELAGYTFTPGVHSYSARLQAVLAQNGVLDPATGISFDERKLFALGGGIGFMYFLFEYQGHAPMMTFVCQAWSLPWPLVERALTFAGIQAYLSETGSTKKAQAALDVAMENGKAAYLVLDAASLPWTGADPVWRGQMPHPVNVLRKEGMRYLIDDGAAYWLEESELAAARAAVKKQKHRLLTFEKGRAASDPALAMKQAIAFTARNYVESPVKGFAGNFGLKGLEKMAALMSGTKDKKSWSRVFSSGENISSGELAFKALLRTWECATLDFTAPAGGRPYYAAFLEEAASLTALDSLNESAATCHESGLLFEQLADSALALGGEVLEKAKEFTLDIDEVRLAGSDDAGEQVRALKGERDALAADLDLDENARSSAFAELGALVTRIAQVETRLANSLSAAIA